MAHTPHDEPQKVLLVPESLYDATSAYVDRLERTRLQGVGTPGVNDGATDASSAESSENHRSGRSTRGLGVDDAAEPTYNGDP